MDFCGVMAAAACFCTDMCEDVGVVREGWQVEIRTDMASSQAAYLKKHSGRTDLLGMQQED